MENITCKTCRFYRTVSAHLGDCRYNLPALGGQSKWPSVTELDWCRFWKDGTQVKPVGDPGRPAVASNETVLQAIAGGIAGIENAAGASDLHRYIKPIIPMARTTLLRILTELEAGGRIKKTEMAKYYVPSSTGSPPEELE